MVEEMLRHEPAGKMLSGTFVNLPIVLRTTNGSIGHNMYRIGATGDPAIVQAVARNLNRLAVGKPEVLARRLDLLDAFQSQFKNVTDLTDTSSDATETIVRNVDGLATYIRLLQRQKALPPETLRMDTITSEQLKSQFAHLTRAVQSSSGKMLREANHALHHCEYAEGVDAMNGLGKLQNALSDLIRAMRELMKTSFDK
jgi:ABC-type transporter Mla subunit MlaD